MYRPLLIVTSYMSALALPVIIYAALPSRPTLLELQQQDARLGGIGGAGVGALGANCFQELKKFGCDTGNVECTPKVGGLAQGGEGGGLNPEFACRLVTYFRAHPDQRIISAYRSAAKQQSMCGSGGSGCAPAGKSCHQYGLAVDVQGITLGVKQKEHGLIRAYSGPHLQCEENSTASCSKDTIPCSGMFRDDPRNAFQNSNAGSQDQNDMLSPRPNYQPSANSDVPQGGGSPGVFDGAQSASVPPQQVGYSPPALQGSCPDASAPCHGQYVQKPQPTNNVQKKMNTQNVLPQYSAPHGDAYVPFVPTRVRTI